MTSPPKSSATAATRPRQRPAAPGQLSLEAVAKLARVSSATVSRVINHPELVAAATVTRVKSAIRRSGYVPNRIAGGLASNRTGLIAVVVPSIANSVFNDTIQAMTEELVRGNYQVMLGLSGYGPEDVSNMLESILSRRPDGVILTGFRGAAGLRQQLRNLAVPIIETWELPQRPLDLAVGFSHARAGSDQADFIYRRGYRRPYLISAEGPRARMRRDAFWERFKTLHAGEIAGESVPMPSTVAHGREALAGLAQMKSQADVVVCSSDWLALGVMIEAKERGIVIPDNIGVVGFGDLEFSTSLAPALTTVRVDGAAIGRESVRLLMARRAGDRLKSRFIDVGTTIIERGSTRRARNP